ncbi:MAG TPA: hypothetical protein VK813_10860 [Edaphobacter sp.]|jgi:hypothetical protein|nr:hypothetical protein [Edaphobacter sp.]
MRKWRVHVGFIENPSGDYYYCDIAPMEYSGAVPVQHQKTFEAMVNVLLNLGLSAGQIEFVRRNIAENGFVDLLPLYITEEAAEAFGSVQRTKSL